MNVGFIGLGIMGKPMVANLIKGGHTLWLASRSGVPQELITAGGKTCASAKEVAQKSDVIITMVPDTPDVEKVLFAKDGVAEGLSPGKIVVDMSSISPIETKAFADRIRKSGADYVDAPVSGGEVGAKNAALTIMVGASEAAFAKVKPLFELMGKNITLVGEVGAGQICKVCNQVAIGGALAGVSEAFALAKKAGVDAARVRQALLGGFAASRVLEVHGERMLVDNYKPGFRARLYQKDMRLANEAAAANGVSMPATAVVAQLLNALIASGGADLDYAALGTVLFSLAGAKRIKN